MILGDTCTRACKFCNVKTGNPKGFIDQGEIENSSQMVATMGLKYIVITSVDRDDLRDHGSAHFAAVVERINSDHPDTMVEVLIPDFDNNAVSMDILARSNPFVIAQNIETVKDLTSAVRDPRAGYQKSLDVLKYYKTHYPHITTKSSLMLGLGETRDQIEQTMRDLRASGVSILTMGQYLQPSRRHLKIERFYHPDEFQKLKEIAESYGFEFVASGPMIRSSYKASEFMNYLENKRHEKSKLH